MHSPVKMRTYKGSLSARSSDSISSSSRIANSRLLQSKRLYQKMRLSSMNLNLSASRQQMLNQLKYLTAHSAKLLSSMQLKQNPHEKSKWKMSNSVKLMLPKPFHPTACWCTWISRWTRSPQLRVALKHVQICEPWPCLTTYCERSRHSCYRNASS